MEQFVLGIFQEQLSKFIVGFRKEQVNANLLNGKGEIHNVELNCAFLNEELAKVTPYIQLEEVHLSKLSFHVSSWANIRKAPIVVDIEHVTATVVEPLHYRERKARRRIRQVTNGELLDMIREGLIKPGKTPYNLFDRILDNLTVEISSVKLRYQTWGKFKTRRPGPWTPPEVQITLGALRLFSVNEFGQESPPEEVWRHNHLRKGGSFLLYKKVEMEYKVAIKPHDSTEPITLVSGTENKMEVHLAVQRRIKDGAWLALQVDVTIPRVEVDLPSHAVPLLAQLASGVTYCLAKDRGFVDPLKPTSQAGNSSGGDLANVTVDQDPSEEEVLDNDEDLEEIAGIVDIDEEAMSSEDEHEEKVEPTSTINSQPETDKPQSQNPVRKSSRPSNILDASSEKKPVIILPNGIIIHDKISISVSLHDISLRGTYAKSADGHIQTTVKGCVVEAIWPKVTAEKGGYVQASLSFVSVEEKNGTRIRPLLVGGVQFDNSGPPEDAKKPLMKVMHDETFPFYEERSVRPDPLGLRHSFPAQALGFKASVDFATRYSDADSEDVEAIQVLNEIGIEKFNIVLDSASWSRAVCFALNEEGRGFDSRWHSGDWSSELTTDMLVQSSGRLKLDEHIQETKDIFLDENDLVSSDLFNVTMRVTDIVARVPAAIDRSLRACDVVINMGETMIVVSSALPRTMLSGRIGTAVNGDDSTLKGDIDFPNDPADVAYVLERREDPINRQKGQRTSRPISTFRAQITCRNYSISLVPVIPSCSSAESQVLLAPSEFSTLLCFEGEPPLSKDDDEVKTFLFVSFVVHRCVLNLDFDLIQSLLSTAQHHVKSCGDTISTCAGLFKRDTPKQPVAGASDGQVKKSIHGRRILVQKQFRQSRQRGGLSVACCVQVAELRLSLWRQNAPIGPLKAFHSSNDSTTMKENDPKVDLLLISEIVLKVLEVGVEGKFHGSSRQLVCKLCLSAARVSACKTDLLLDSCSQNVSSEMVTLVSVGDIDTVDASSDPTTILRVEEAVEECRAWSLALNGGRGSLVVDLQTLGALYFLIRDAIKFPRDVEDSIREATQPLISILRNLGRKSVSNIDELESEVKRGLISCLPSDLELCLARVSITDFSVHFPVKDTANERAGFGLVLHDVNFKLGSLMTDRATTLPLLTVRADAGKTWLETMEFSEGPDIRHSFSSCQSLEMLANEKQSLVSPFRVGYLFKDATTKVITPPDGINLADLNHLRAFSRCLATFARETLSSINVVMSSRPKRNGKDKGSRYIFAMSERFKSVIDRLTILQSRLNQVEQVSASREVEIRSRVAEYERRVTDLQMRCFKKERERIAALGVVSSEVVGWLRMGAALKTGQRGTLSCTLWPYWCILRRSLLIVYKAPGHLDPVEIIPIGGASLEQLAGGRKKDLKRAMALVENTGMVRLLIAGSDADFYVWVKAFLRYAHGEVQEPTESVTLRTSSPVLNPETSSAADVHDEVERRPRLARVAQAAKATKERAIATRQAVAERRKKGTDKTDDHSVDSSIDNDAVGENTLDTSEHNGTRRRFVGMSQVAKTRFAGAGQATKNRFGNALQAAREKGKSAVVSTRSRLGSESNGDTEPSSSVYSAENEGSVDPFASSNANDDLESEARETPSKVVTDASAAEVGQPLASGGHEDDARRRSGMRQRLGAAVKSVRRNPRTGENEGNESDVAALRSVRLKDVVTRGPIQTPPYPLQSDVMNEIPMKSLEGQWFARVEANREDPPNIGDESPNPESQPIDGAIVPPLNEPGVEYLIRLYHYSGEGSGKEPAKETRYTTSQILAYHATLSESIVRHLPGEVPTVTTSRDASGAMTESLARALGVSALDAVKLTGAMLEGLLNCPSQDCEDTLKYKAETVSEFLNSMLQTPLPIDALVIMSDFLGISECSSSSFVPMPQRDVSAIDPVSADGTKSTIEITQLLAAARSNTTIADDLVRLIQQILIPATLEGPIVDSHDAVLELATSTPDGGATQAFHDAVHTVLVQVMAERDESHARMVAAGVLHVHEIEQLRKQVRRLTARLEAGANGDPRGQERVQHLEREMQQDSDMELVSLCQQLAGEISARTNASLEVIRLKESRKIERDTEEAEKKALMQETQAARDALANERARAEKAELEMEKWKSAYDNLAQAEHDKIIGKETGS